MRKYALLIRKDLISALGAYKGMVVLFVIWFALLAFSPGGGPMLFIMMVFILVIALFSTEENELVCNVTGILPIRRGQAVTARYLYTYGVLIFGFALGSVASLIGTTIRGTGVGISDGWLESLILSASMALLMVSISMPLIYRFGVIKMKVLTMIIYVVMIAAATSAISLFDRWMSVSSMTISLLALAGTVVLSLVSLGISQRVVQR